MITDSFDIKTEAIISPEHYYGPQKHLADICIVTLSRIIMEEVRENFKCKKVAEIGSCSGNIPIYTFDLEVGDGESIKVGILLSNIGSVAAGICITEANWLIGATKFIMFGSAGSLDAEIAMRNYVIPTKAYRDEGMSYHYVPPADYIDVPGAEKVMEVFDRLGIPYASGYCWTTDTWYRETRGLMAARKAEGCIAVDMEVSGAQAVCDFYGLELYNFLETGDTLDTEEYDVDGLFDANHNLRNIKIALEIAKAIMI